MRVTVVCPNADCRKSYLVAEEYLGRRGECKKCGTTFTFVLSGSLVTPLPAADDGAHPKPNQDGLGPSSPSRSGSAVPQRLGRFEIRERLGSGGFGTVYRAYDPQLQRDVALKLLQITGDEKRDRQRIDRFLVEGRAAARLQHPHIVPVFDAGFDKETGEYYQAASFIEGRTLASEIDEQPMVVRRAAGIVRKLAQALGYAHVQGILHRDVKPDNVMLDAQDEPYVMDFGLARIEESAEKLTQDGTLMGTAAYMSPEQWQGRPDLLTSAADQYSLGIVLYELLTGETPFSGPPHVQSVNHLRTEPSPPSQRNPAVPKDLETICLKTLSKEPGGRYPSCFDLADDLDRWLQDEPIRARRISASERLFRWRRRNPILAGMTCAVAALLLAVAVVSTFAAFRLDQEKRRADANAAEALEQKQRAEAEAAESQKQTEAALRESQRAYRHYYAVQMNLAQGDWESGNPESLRTRLGRTRPGQTGGQDLRGFEWHFWNRLCQNESRRLTHADSITCLAFSPDGQRVASSHGKGPSRGAICVWDVRTGEQLFELEENKPITSVAFSPDGRRIAGGMDKTVKVWDASAGEELRSLRGHRHSVQSVTFSPDGKRVASGADGPGGGVEVKVWDFDSGRPSNEHEQDSGSVAALAFTRTGDRLMIASGRAHGGNPFLTITALDADTGERRLHTRCETGPLAAAFDPSGGRIVTAAAGFRDGRLTVWDVESGEEVLTLEGHTRSVRSIAFSPDGGRIVSASDDKTVQIWDAVTGDELSTFAEHGREVAFVTFSPDGRRIASGTKAGVGTAGAELLVWDAALGQKYRTVRGHAGVVNSASFSPDGRCIASGGSDKSLRLWDAATGHELHVFDGLPHSVRCVDFSPSGDRVAASCNRGMFRADARFNRWSAATGPVYVWDVKALQRPSRYDTRVGTIAFSPDGTHVVGQSSSVVRHVASGDQVIRGLTRPNTSNFTCFAISRDGGRIVTGGEQLDTWHTLVLWDASTGAELMVLRGHDGGVSSVGFSPNGRRIVSGSDDASIKVWDSESGCELLNMQGHGGLVSAVAFSPDGERIVSASADGMAKLWDSRTGLELLTLQGHIGPVMTVAFSPDGARLVTGGEDHTLKLWDATPAVQESTLRGHLLGVNAVAVSPDSRRIASGSDDETMKLWDVETGRELATLVGDREPQGLSYHSVKAVVFSPDGARVASSRSSDGVTIWDVESGRPLTTIRGDSVGGVSFSPDGRRIAGSQGGLKDHALKVWDAESGRELLSVEMDGFAKSVTFDAAGRRIAAGGSGGDVRIWDAETGKEASSLHHAHPSGRRPESVVSVAFSPDDARIASGSGTSAIVWDIADGAELVRLQHRRAVNGVAFSPDGKRIVTASGSRFRTEGTVTIWDAQTGHELAVLRGHTGSVQCVAFSPDGRRIVSGGEDRAIKVWEPFPAPIPGRPAASASDDW